MPSFSDSAVIFFIALLLFGPKKLPELARQLGKLMAEFRRASNEFRIQMEDELRVADQEEQRKKTAAMEAAAPVTPAIADTSGTQTGVQADMQTSENTIAPPASDHSDVTPERISQLTQELIADYPPMQAPTEPLPIATSGDLNLMPPSTGLPVSNSALSPVLDAIPRDSETAPVHGPTTEAPLHG
jgi:sec-independent protein translocase protein TatB